MSLLFNVRVLPAVIAMFYAVLAAVLLFVPYVAREHRKRGELGAGTATLRFGALLYVHGLIAYVLIPLPPVSPTFCADLASVAVPQLRPLATLDGVPPPHVAGDLLGLLTYDQVQQFLLNILLFVPLGAFARHLFGRGVFTILLLGFGASLFIEVTQYTGIWYFYPCPYRMFDVDDLVANTVGALAGRCLAPALRLLPGQRVDAKPEVPRPVTPYRRLMGMACDTLLLWWIGGTALRIADVLQEARPWPWFAENRLGFGSVLLWFGPAVLLLLATLVGRGTSLGQYAVRLRCVQPGRRSPSAGATLRRWLAGIGGLGILQGAVSAVGYSVLWMPVFALWGAVHAVGVLRGGDRRGISGRAAGVIVVDGRSGTSSRAGALTRTAGTTTGTTTGTTAGATTMGIPATGMTTTGTTTTGSDPVRD